MSLDLSCQRKAVILKLDEHYREQGNSLLVQPEPLLPKSEKDEKRLTSAHLAGIPMLSGHYCEPVSLPIISDFQHFPTIPFIGNCHTVNKGNTCL